MKPQITQITQITQKNQKAILSRRVIGCALAVHQALGPGHLEAVYENALAIELNHQHIAFSRQPRIEVHYRQQTAGLFRPDFIIEEALLLELKAIRALSGADRAQLLNYLKATGLKAGLLLNFGAPSLQIQRMVNGLSSRVAVRI